MSRPAYSRTRSCKMCRRPVPRHDHFYCYDHWVDLIDSLAEEVERLARDAAEVYIGRTCDPTARREEHSEETGRDMLTVLHWSDDVDEICVVEEALIREVDYLKKLSNATDESLGGVRPDLRNCVYVSWRAKRRRTGRR